MFSRRESEYTKESNFSSPLSLIQSKKKLQNTKIILQFFIHQNDTSHSRFLRIIISHEVRTEGKIYGGRGGERKKKERKRERKNKTRLRKESVRRCIG